MAREEIQGGFPEPDLIIVEDYVQNDAADASGRLGERKPYCALRLHMEIELSQGDLNKAKQLMLKSDNQAIYDLIKANYPGKGRGFAVMKAVLGL
jgi:hypothetical protein